MFSWQFVSDPFNSIELTLIVRARQVAEASLALFSCAEMTFLGYTYAAIKTKEHYQRATGCVKAGMLSGKCVSGVLGQFVVYIYGGDYSILNYYSLASMITIRYTGGFQPIFICVHSKLTTLLDRTPRIIFKVFSHNRT